MDEEKVIMNVSFKELKQFTIASIISFGIIAWMFPNILFDSNVFLRGLIIATFPFAVIASLAMSNSLFLYQRKRINDELDLGKEKLSQGFVKDFGYFQNHLYSADNMLVTSFIAFSFAIWNVPQVYFVTWYMGVMYATKTYIAVKDMKEKYGTTEEIETSLRDRK